MFSKRIFPCAFSCKRALSRKRLPSSDFLQTEEFPSDVEGYCNLGLAYLRKEEIDQAIASLEKATESSPDIIQVHLALGGCSFNKGETENALEIFKKTTGNN